MTKEKYMQTLRERFNQLEIEGSEDILNDFEAHFTLGRQNGHSDEELMASLGSIEEILESYESVNKSNDDTLRIDGHNQKKEYTNKITTLDISARHADTKIVTSKDGGFHVDLYKEGKLLERLSHTLIAYQEENIFFVKVLPLFPHKSSGQYDLNIQIPNDLPILLLNSSSGNGTLEHINVNEIRINSASGDFKLMGIKAERFDIEVASSDFQISDVLGDMHIRSASGDFQIERSNGKAFHYQSASGDLNLIGDYAAIHIANVSGDVNTELKTIEQMHVSNTSGDVKIKIENTNNFQVTASSVNGDCEVFRAGEALMLKHLGSVQVGEPKTQIKLSTISGDIRLDLE